MTTFEEKIVEALTTIISEVQGTTANSNIVEFISLLFVGAGGAFALLQWWKSNVYKRGEIVEKLISKVRNNQDIATIMDIIDWDKGFYYDGEMRVSNELCRKELKGISDGDLFKKIDETLSCFSYICYLKKQFTLTKKDMKNFEYEIRRLFDNEHIVNYLYSLYHWSASLGVPMSFSFLVDYGIKKKYISRDFKSICGNSYELCLDLQGDYAERMLHKEKNIFVKLLRVLRKKKKTHEKTFETVDFRQ